MENDFISNNLIIKDLKNTYNIYKNASENGRISSNFFFIPLVILIFSLYFSFIQRKIGKNYDKEYKEKIVILKKNEEDRDVIDEALDRMKNKYDKLRNQQFNVFLVALLKCILSYENLIGASMIIYCFYKVFEGYNLYKLDIRYLNKKLLNNKDNEEEFKKIVQKKVEVKIRFRNIVFHNIYYTFTLFFGYNICKSRSFWEVVKINNSIVPSSEIMNYLFGLKNICIVYLPFYIIYVILYKLLIERIYNVFDNFSQSFISLFKSKQNVKFIAIYVGSCSLCLLKSALIYH